MTLKRVVTIPLMIAVLCASIPAPSAFATSTGTEIQIGKQQDKQITDSTNVVTDPLLNAWVNDVTSKLWAQVARKDVPYNVKILDVTDINAFSTLGGYLYINEGTLDFVQSDDELASVLGHETAADEQQGQFVEHSVRPGFDFLTVPVPLRATRRSRHHRQGFAHRRTRSR
jgi:hypothetical protein